MLDRVTITGADDTIWPGELLVLSREFPFVEWALLFSRHRDQGKPRWPSSDWLQRLFASVRGRSETPKFAVHLCGKPCDLFLQCDRRFEDVIDNGLLQLCRRIQLNTHGEPATWDAAKASGFIREYAPLADIICQIDGMHGPKIMEDYLAEEIPAFAFHDLSHGAGVLPFEWPKAEYMDNDSQVAYHGFGGGLGPENLEAEIPKILAAAGNGRCWIDMETRVRSQTAKGDIFDLKKVRQCLEIASKFINR